MVSRLDEVVAGGQAELEVPPAAQCGVRHSGKGHEDQQEQGKTGITT